MNNTVKVLFVSIDGMTDSLGQSQVIPYMTGLAGQGYSITILSLEKKVAFSRKSAEIKDLLDEHGISWEPLDYSTSIPLVSQYFNYRRLLHRAIQLQQQNNFRIIHCRNYLSGLIGLHLQAKFNTRFLFDMRGFWANERIDGGMWSLNNPIHRRLFRFFKNKETELLLKADYTISLTQRAVNEFMSWPALKNKIIPTEVIPCCVDLTLFDRKKNALEETAALKTKLGIKKGDLIVSYLGSIGTWYMLDEMLAFFKKLLKKKPHARFLIISHDNTDAVIEVAAKHGIPVEKIILTSSPRSKVPAHLLISDFCLYFIKPLYSKIASSPTKMGEILAMGKPIITNSGIGDCDQLITENKIGILIRGFTESEYEEAVNKMDSMLEFNPDHFSEVAKKFFSLEKGVMAYKAIYEKLS